MSDKPEEMSKDELEVYLATCTDTQYVEARRRIAQKEMELAVLVVPTLETYTALVKSFRVEAKRKADLPNGKASLVAFWKEAMDRLSQSVHAQKRCAICGAPKILVSFSAVRLGRGDDGYRCSFNKFHRTLETYPNIADGTWLDRSLWNGEK